jgi:hypothetical protein
VLQTDHGVHFGDVNFQWWSTRIKNLDASLGYIDPTHLPIYLTKDVLLYCGESPFGVCSAGFHGASTSDNGNGNQPVQTFAWTSYLSPGLSAQPNGGGRWAFQDIYGVSHEISELADNPLITNTVETWVQPTFPQGGCISNLLETGDPAVNIGFAMGTNVYFQGPNPDGTQSADGYYHPTEEAFLPWFTRVAPNNIAEPTQSPSTNIGRYTLMGDLNPLAAFHQPATGCD